MDNTAVIESITCPITGDIMKDPVQGNDGHTYERTAIMKWLSQNPISPQTRDPMSISDLKVNASIRFLCDKYHAGELGTDTRAKTPPKISTNDIKVNHSMARDTENQTMLTFEIDKNSMPELCIGHLSQDVVLVIDHSGSTGLAVEAKDDDGNSLENGMSILDIVNHAAGTVTKSLDKNSRLAIIIFDDQIEILLELTLMTEMNCSRALAEITNIKARGRTAIWSAIEKAITILHHREDKSRNGAIIMLTDGVPNIKPARGEVETLKRLRKSLNFTSPLYTFGFGYSLECGLLYDLAKHGNGGNGHIPDGGMIATVFCHAIATILSTVVVNLQLHISYTEDINYISHPPVLGDFVYNVDEENSRNVIVDLGCVQLDQIRHIILNTFDLNSSFKYYYTYKIGGQSFTSDVIEISSVADIVIDEDKVSSNVGRFMVVETLRKIINLKNVNEHENATDLFDVLVEHYGSLHDKLSVGILKNLNGNGKGEGQVKLAVTNNVYFKKWGEFYLDQLTRSLNQETKPNFRDTACPFGGDLGEKLVDAASDIFDTLPPPKPSRLNNTEQYRGLGMGQRVVVPVAPVRIAQYNSQDTGNPCFVGSCLIHLADGTRKPVKDLCKGDKVFTLSDVYDRQSEYSIANVVCVLKTITSGFASLVTFDDGLKITPWHPIAFPRGNDWEFPANIKVPVMESCSAVYSILLDRGHSCLINNVWCIGLGHSYDYGVLKHEYFGSSAIVDDMKKHYGWDHGRVVIMGHNIIRDPLTTKIISILGKGKAPMT